MIVRTLGSWLAAWMYFLDISLGSLAVLLMHRLTGGVWIAPIERYLRAALAPLPLLVLLFVPVAVASFHLFPWSAWPAAHGAMAFTTHYLAPWPFIARSGVALVAWCVLAWMVRHHRPPRAGVAAAGLIVWSLAVTWSAVDWIASLEPHWSSSILGLTETTVQGLAAFAFVSLCMTRWSPVARLRARERPERPNQRPVDPGGEPVPDECGDLANLLLTFTMTWAYLAFMQFLIIWAEDLPRETSWYLPRVQHSWRTLSLAVVLLQFAVPFALLLFRRIKRDPAGLALIASLLLIGNALYVFWLIVPSLTPDALNVSWTDPVALIVIGIPWLWLVRRDLARPVAGTRAPFAADQPEASHAR